MEKRQLDTMKHSGKKNSCSSQKNHAKGGKGWGAITDYSQNYSYDDYGYIEEEKTFETEEIAAEAPVPENERKQGEYTDIPNQSLQKNENYAEVHMWSVADVKAWILEFGGSFSTIAETFETCGIDGETLLFVTEEDIRGTCGKGLASKKILVEIKRLMQRFAASSQKNTKQVDTKLNQVEPIVLTKPKAPMLYYAVAPLELCSLDDHLNKIMDIPPFTILNVTNVRAGVAEINFPTKGCVSLLNENEKPVCKRLFMIDGFPYTSEEFREYHIISFALEALKNHRVVFNANLSLYGTDGNFIADYGDVECDVKTFQEFEPGEECLENYRGNWLRVEFLKQHGTTQCEVRVLPCSLVDRSPHLEIDDTHRVALKDLKRIPKPQVDVKAVLEEIEDGSCIIHLLKYVQLQVETWNLVPELVIQRSKKSIAWQLLKAYLIQNHKCNGEQIEIIAKAFRSKNKIDIFTEKVQNDERVVIQGSGRINRSYWMSQAIVLKNFSEKQVLETSLRRYNRPASENYLGLIGSTEANIGRYIPSFDEDTIEDVIHSLNLSKDKDSDYRLFRHFLRYADALTSAVGNLLDELFDEDLVDVIISFVDTGCETYISKLANVQYSGTGSKCLDFYATFSPNNDCQMSDLSHQLDEMWKEHPTTCIRLIFQLGAAREGKQDLHGFYCAMHWLFQNHPCTLLANIHLLPEINYYKGMLEVLERVLENDEDERLKRNNWYKKYHNKGKKTKKKPQPGSDPNPENNILGPQCYNMSKLDRARRCITKFQGDLMFRAIHNKVANVFASHLREDLQKKHNLTLAAKWCPTSGGKHDTNLLMYEAVCRKVFPPTLPEFENDSEFEYWHKVRNRLRQEVLTPLRKKLKVTETFVSRHQSNRLNYSKIPGSAIKKHEKTFIKQDPEGWNQYLADLSSGKANVKVNVGAIGPVQLYKEMKSLVQSGRDSETNIALINGQWKQIVEKLKQKIPQEERNVVAAVDLSGSMSAITSDPKLNCMQVAIALGLICSEISTEGYKDHMVLFTTIAKMAHIKGESFYERYKSFESQRFGGGTAFDPIFMCIQNCANELGMPKRVVILSDMEFQHGSRTPIGRFVPIYLESKCVDIEVKQGMEPGTLHRPEVVFWNINNRGTPARKTDQGCSLVSGYAASTFTEVLCNSWKDMQRDEISKKNDPLTIMLNSVSKPLFKKIRVVTSQEEARVLLKENLNLTITLKNGRVISKKIGKKKAVAQIIPDFSNVKTSHKTALCLIPSEEDWGQIQAIRKNHDRAYRRWMPHINLFFPFIEDEDKNLEDFANHVLRPICETISPFTLQLNKIDAFKRKKDAQIFVGPENITELSSLWQFLREKMPSKVMTENQSDFHPHLSLGQFPKRRMQNVKQNTQVNWTSIPWTVDRIYVTSRHGDVPFEIREEILLGCDLSSGSNSTMI